MTGRSWGDRRAESFQNALDGHVDLAERELYEFVQLAHSLRDAPPVTLRDDARGAIRARLVAEAESVLGDADVPEAPAPRRRRRRGVRALVGSTAAAAALSAGLVTVSADALPGDVLYPIKRGVEQLEFTFGGGGTSTGRVHLEHASERLDEAVALARSGGDADQISETLRDFTSDARTGTGQLLRAYTSGGDAAMIAEIRTFTNESAEQLSSLAPMLGRSTDSAFTAAVTAVETADRRAIDACPTCAGGPAVQVPYMDGSIGRVHALPDEDNRAGGSSDSSGQDDIVADPKNIPEDADLPPVDDEHVEHDNDGGTGETTGPTLEGGSSSESGSSSVDEPTLDPDSEHDNGTAVLPDDDDLVPGTDDIVGGKVDLGPLEDALGPLDDLLGSLGPLGDLLDPLLGGDQESKSGKDDTKGPLDGLLGPLLRRDHGTDRGGSKPDKIQREHDGTEKSADDGTGGDPDQQEDGDGPLEDLIGPVDETEDAPDVDQDGLDGPTNDSGTTDQGSDDASGDDGSTPAP